MMGARGAAWGYCLAGVLMAAPAAAQPGRDARVELAAGLGWRGAVHFPAVTATEVGPNDKVVPVFQTASSLDASPGLVVTVGARLSRRLAIESALSMNRTQLSVAISNDVEGVPNLTASEPVTQYLVEGGIRVAMPRRHRGAFEPFLAAGGGYLRQLNEGQTLINTGSSIYAGGGAHYWLRRGGRGWIESSGIRIDARVSVLNGGVAIDGGRHAAPVAGVGLFFRF